MKKHFKEHWFIYLIFSVVTIVVAREINTNKKPTEQITFQEEPLDYWLAPSLYLDNITKGDKRRMIIYGQDLIANTSKYFGPHGSVNQISNGMNCQNCHLDAGGRPWGNNYGAVVSTYPKFRERSGTIENIPKRVNDCFERSLNGKAIDTSGYEMKSIIAYMKWLGQNVKKGEKPKGAGIVDLPYLDRAASPAKGQIVYIQKCQSCHSANGEGLKVLNEIKYTYPPLWGEVSYNTGAGLFRLSRFAGYVKDNMPFNQATHQAPVLTDQEAWDVAAFVNSQPRPNADLTNDWPNIAAKPFDHPFGPYADGFNEDQHKYGPFKPIVAKRKEMKKIASGVEVENMKK
ncbi:MAG: c-type cytochrome [Ferruginibacter sp.]